MAAEEECNPSCSLLGLSSRWDSPKQHGLLCVIHRNRASGGGHLRTGALPARHSCELALLSCFPYQQSPLINAGVFNSSKNNRGPSPECVYVVSGSATSWLASEGKNLSRRDLNGGPKCSSSLSSSNSLRGSVAVFSQ